jgi:hypothetical protein
MLYNDNKNNKLIGCPKTSKSSYNIVSAVKNRFHDITSEINEEAICKNRKLRKCINANHPVSNPV